MPEQASIEDQLEVRYWARSWPGHLVYSMAGLPNGAQSHSTNFSRSLARADIKRMRVKIPGHLISMSTRCPELARLYTGKGKPCPQLHTMGAGSASRCAGGPWMTWSNRLISPCPRSLTTRLAQVSKRRGLVSRRDSGRRLTASRLLLVPSDDVYFRQGVWLLVDAGGLCFAQVRLDGEALP